MSYIVRKATAEDALQIQHFIAKTGVNGIDPETDWTSFLIGEGEDQQIVSIIRIQTMSEEVGLLRSLVVDTNIITPLFILEFLEATLYYAEDKGLKDMYILTHTENSFLQTLGFTKVTPSLLPKKLSKVSFVKDHLENNLPILVKRKELIHSKDKDQ